jgi:hypothetical protein
MDNLMCKELQLRWPLCMYISIGIEELPPMERSKPADQRVMPCVVLTHNKNCTYVN